MFDLCMDWGSFLRDGLGCYGMRIQGVPNVMSLASNDVDYFMRKRKNGILLRSSVFVCLTRR